MSLVINHNALSARAAGSLNKHYSKLSTSTQRLSSGLRINSAVDDSAGLAIQELQKADVTALRQGARNANDAISLLQTADGALGIIDEKLLRMRELSEQAATGTYDSTQRLLINQEYMAMASEINRIADATSFNNIHLLNGNLAGEHNGSGLNSTGAAKIHFGPGNDAKEDYYYIEMGDASTAGLFGGFGAGFVTNFEKLSNEQLVPGIGDAEGQYVMGLPNGNALVLVNDHGSRDIRLREYSSDGTLLRQNNVPWPAGSTGVMAPFSAKVLPDGNTVVGFNSWADIGGTHHISTITLDPNLTVVPGSGANLIDVPVTPGAAVARYDDMGMSVTGDSVLVSASVDRDDGKGFMLEVGLSNPDGSGVTQVRLGTSTNAENNVAATAVNDRHFVVTEVPGGGMEGYFVNRDGTASPALPLGTGSKPRVATVGDKVVLTYFTNDPATGRVASFARVVNPDGSMGAETPLHPPDAGADYRVSGVDVMRSPDGALLDQVIFSYTRTSDPTKLFATVFNVRGSSLASSGLPNLEFVGDIPGTNIARNNIAVLADGNIVADWQDEMGGIDRNALTFMRPIATAGRDLHELRIDTQERAQRMLVRIEEASVRKDSIRAHVGALQNRFENTISNLNIQAENLQVSASRIGDVDVATETTEMVRRQILTQSSVAMLSQANSLPKMALQVLGG